MIISSYYNKENNIPSAYFNSLNNNQATEEEVSSVQSVAAESQASEDFSIKHLTIDKIASVYSEKFKEGFSLFDSSKAKEPIRSVLLNSQISCLQAKELTLANGKTYLLGFSLQLSAGDAKTYRKKIDREIGFFNFKVTLIRSKKTEEECKISYFSEIEINKDFQSVGLSKFFINPYTAMLQELEIDIDYLHVKSQKAFTASLYEKAGYAFTPSSLNALNENYEGRENYLKDSSVSFSDVDPIEMYRRINPSSSAEVKTSIPDLEASFS